MTKERRLTAAASISPRSCIGRELLTHAAEGPAHVTRQLLVEELVHLQLHDLSQVLHLHVHVLWVEHVFAQLPTAPKTQAGQQRPIDTTVGPLNNVSA